jgi:hypothetical protein
MFCRDKRILSLFPEAKLLPSSFDDNVFTIHTYICSNPDELSYMKCLISDVLISTSQVSLEEFQPTEPRVTEPRVTESESSNETSSQTFYYFKRTKCKKVSLYWVWQDKFQLIYIKGFVSMIKHGLYVSEGTQSEVEFVFYPSQVRNKNIKNISVTGEHKMIEDRFVDIHLTYLKEGNRHLTYPYFAQIMDMFSPKYEPLFSDSPEVTQGQVTQEQVTQEKEFCAFVHSNGNNPIRNKFFQFLCTYKKVNSYGSLLNNMGYIEKIDWTSEKQIELLSRHKFVLCFENSRDDNDYYITEKLINAKLSGAVPIYWGTSKCLEIFEEGSFLFLEKEDNLGFFKLLNEIKELDTNNEKYMRMKNKKLIDAKKIKTMRTLLESRLELILLNKN